MDTVCNRAGEGIRMCGEHLQELYIVYLTRFQTYKRKLLYHPKQKPRRGGGLRQINACRKVPLQDNFLRKADISDWSLLAIWYIGGRRDR
jgi:hypothetical protein